jgi:DegV family protein with EDD domain
MAAVHIVCDSTADLDPAYRSAHDLRVVPLKVIFGDEVLEDGVSIDAAAFYARMRASTTHPRTSQPTPAEFEAVFREAGADGGPIVCTTIAADLSGTYASATQARAVLPDQDIRVIDSRSAAIGHQAMVRQAVRVAEAGGGVVEVELAIAEVQATQRLLFTVETLEYLRRGGRIGGARALLGSMLDIKPILELRDGVIEPVDRVRTYVRALDRIASETSRQAQAWGGADIYVAHADHVDVGTQVAERLRGLANVDVVLTDVGPVIGCHAGPGAIGVAFHRRLS